jgi:catechol 2,3-dioxygenase-like lactoylglutathione lyase family enzyme
VSASFVVNLVEAFRTRGRLAPKASGGGRSAKLDPQGCVMGRLFPHSFRVTREGPMGETSKPRVVGLNHVALEVGDIDEALAFYRRLFAFELRSKNDTMAFIDLGDQFIALQKGRKQPPDDNRHFGLVVDDKEAARWALGAAGVASLGGPFLDFRDPWGNRIEIVGYDNVQFTKAPNVLRGMGLMQLTKKESAKKELADKGMPLG